MSLRVRENSMALWGADNSAISMSPKQVELAKEARIEKARHFYFNEKFIGCTFAQNLAKANIKKDQTEGTIDQEGRFRAFRLDHDSKNAQLQGFELFPLAAGTNKDAIAPLHHEGYRLFLKLLDFVEEDPIEHEGIVRIGIDSVRERLTQIDRYKLNALLIVCLNHNGRTLSRWEKEKFDKAIEELGYPDEQPAQFPAQYESASLYYGRPEPSKMVP